MVKGRGGLGLALEALKGDRILRELLRQELQCGTATQLEIFGLVHHPHTTAAEDLQHSVLTDLLPGQVAEQSRCLREVCRRHVWRYRFQPFDRGDQAISPAGESLDVTWGCRRIPKRPAQHANGDVDAVVEIDDGVVGPEFLLNFASRYQLPGALDEHSEHLEGLLSEQDLVAQSRAQLAGAEIEVE